jgi:DNA polymerase III delta prime subunit
MKISKIKIQNYRILSNLELNLKGDGKHFMLYGENGSGKTALFYALKEVFEGEDLTKSVFPEAGIIPEPEIEITVLDEHSTHTFSNRTDSEAELEPALAAANKFKGFLSYKNLVPIYSNSLTRIELFELLINELLSELINPISNVTFKADLSKVEKLLEKSQTSRRIEEIKKILEDTINPGIRTILQKTQETANTFLQYFFMHISFKFVFEDLKYGRKSLEGKSIKFTVKYCNIDLDYAHKVLNEAKLSAIFICIYLAVIKNYPIGKSIKVLFLDDIFMGLDLPNRLPFLKFLKKEFIDCDETARYQIFLTTYDKSWFEMARLYLGTDDWVYPELFCQQQGDQDREYCIFRGEQGFLENAKLHFRQGDLKATAVYLRTEFERILKTYCVDESIPVKYVFNSSELKSQDFWNSITNQTNLSPEVISEIELYRNIILNPLSHADWSKPAYRSEIEKAIKSVEELPKELSKCTVIKFHELKDDLVKLEKRLKSKDEHLRNLGRRFDELWNNKT